MSFCGLLDKEMSVRRLTMTADAYAGQSVSRSTVYTSIPCRVNALSIEKQMFLVRSGIQATHKFFCSAEDITIQVGDELVIGSSVYPVVSAQDWDENDHHYTILTRYEQ